MTIAQARYLSAIIDYTNQHGTPPSQRDIGKRVGASTTAVNGMTRRLRGRGWLTFKDGRARTYVVTEAGRWALWRLETWNV